MATPKKPIGNSENDNQNYVVWSISKREVVSRAGSLGEARSVRAVDPVDRMIIWDVNDNEDGSKTKSVLI